MPCGLEGVEPVTQSILVPVDGSELSERALEVAIPLARLQGFSLRLLWVREGYPELEDLLTASMVTSFDERESSEGDTYLRRLALLGAGSCEIECDWRVRSGRAADAIVGEAVAGGVRYVVMATHGRSGFRRWRHGSVADRVRRTASTTTVLYRPRPGVLLNDTIERILIPLDGSARSFRALPEAAALARTAGAAVDLLRVVKAVVPLDTTHADVNQMAFRRAEEDLERAALQMDGIIITKELATGDADVAILTAAERSDLVVMASHGRGGLRRAALGSIADTVVRGSGKPVMIIGAAAAA